MPETEITLPDPFDLTDKFCVRLEPSGNAYALCGKPATQVRCWAPGRLSWYCAEHAPAVHAPKDPQAERITALEAQLARVKDQRDRYFRTLGDVLGGRGCLAPSGYWTTVMSVAYREWRETVERYDQLPDAADYEHAAIIRQYLDEQAAQEMAGG